MTFYLLKSENSEIIKYSPKIEAKIEKKPPIALVLSISLGSLLKKSKLYNPILIKRYKY